MWAIRILNGPQAGQIIPLKAGKNTLGRGPTCEIKLVSNGVSKEHATVYVSASKLVLTDLNSRNGTFVNGIRVQSHKLSSGDKVAFHDLLLDVFEAPETAMMALTRPQPSVAPSPQQWAQQNQNLFPPVSAPMGQNQNDDSVPPEMMSIQERITDYIDEVAMPGVYHLAKLFEYRWFVASLVCLYVVMVTMVVMIPTTAMIKESVEDASKRRAITIARRMADVNRTALAERNESAVTTRTAETEDNVTAALIINARDGMVIAPASARGGYSDKTFAVRARKSDKEYIEKNGNQVAVSVPIVGYDSELNTTTQIAYALVFYDLTSTASNDSLIFGLFVQILSIALILGIIFYFFLVKVIEHPLAELNAGLDDALREGRDDLRTDYKFPRLEKLASNINSALSRIGSGNGQDMPVVVNRENEAINLIGMIPNAALAINAIDERIILTNLFFDQLIGGGMDLRGRQINDVPDSTLQINLRELIAKLKGAPDRVATANIPFTVGPHFVRAQAIVGQNGEPAYYVFSIAQLMEDAA